MQKKLTILFFTLLSIQALSSERQEKINNLDLARNVAKWIGLHRGKSHAVHTQKKDLPFLITEISTNDITTFRKEYNHKLSEIILKNGELEILEINNQEIPENTQFPSFEKFRSKLRSLRNQEEKAFFKLLLVDTVPYVKIEFNKETNHFIITPA